MKNKVDEILDEIGVTINGDKPYDIQIHNKRFLTKMLVSSSPSTVAGEAYMNGDWDCEQIDELFYRICRKELELKLYPKLGTWLYYLKNAMFNQQNPRKSREVAVQHYNLSNRLYELMLGKSMAYTCSYWKNAHSLDEAQFDKYDLICKKLHLKPGEKVLELGCGWGGLAKYMAEKYGCEVFAFDIGEGPSSYAKEFCKNLPVTIYQCDYRDTHIYNPNKIKFDKLVSVGVLEHIGYKNYQNFLNITSGFIKPEGIFLLHSIGGNYSLNYCDPWIDKYIFPNGMLPSIKQLGEAFEHQYIVEDFQNFGAYYDKTLLAWKDNFNQNWDELKSSFDERFRRMMNYYLASCAGGFRARGMQLWQFVLSPKGLTNGYTSFR